MKAVPLFLFACLLASCKTIAPRAAGTDTKPSPHAATPASADDVSLPFLLSMNFQEAAAISPQKASLPPHLQVAADTVEVLKTRSDGTPRKVRAKGHVFIQLDYKDQGKALCQEALIDGEDIILRGRPVIQRGTTTIQGTSDVTVFYVLGERLRVIGPHKFESLHDAMRSMGVLSAWKAGPNPLLPPLESNVVPEDVREQLRKSIEAEAALQKSRMGVAPAFPDAKPGPGSTPLAKPVEIPDPKPVKETKDKKP